MRRTRTLALLATVAAAALIPLYGDPRPTAVTHTEWARMVLRGLDMLEAVERVGDEASRAFETLSWKNSLVFPADRYIRGEGVTVVREGDARRVKAIGEVGELVYPFAVVRPGDYRLRARLAGRPEAPAEAEMSAAGEPKPIKEFRLTPEPIPGWVDAGGAHLDPGAYTVTLLLPQGAMLDYVELAPPCLGPIEPPGGWRATALASTEDVAVTVLQALDLEHELPPAASAVERAGADFQVEGGALAVPVGLGPDAEALKAGPQGLRAAGTVEVPEKGVYTVSAFGERGAGQSWLADACRKALLCPAPAGVSAARWWPVFTAELSAGRHVLAVKLADGSVLGRVRVEKKKTEPADYLAALRRIGLDLGPEGKITRDKAVEAMGFLGRRRTLDASAACGEIVLPSESAPSGVLVAEAGQAAPPTTGPGVQLPPVEPGEPLPPPAVPPPVVVSPVRP